MMNPSGDPTTSGASVSGENLTTDGSTASAGGEKAMVALSEREKFLSTYVRNQQWSLPESVIYYILKNPSNSNVYKKMIQSCKYFFVQNPLLVVSDLIVKYEKNQWNTYLNGKIVDLNRVSSNLWITDKLRIYNASSTLKNSLKTVLSKIYQSGVKDLSLHYQKIYISDLQFLASKCEKISLRETTIINEDDSVVGLEKIIEVLPKIETFLCTFSRNLYGASANVMTSETVQKLIQVPHFSNLEYFYLSEIPENFDIDAFYDYIKKNKKTKFLLGFVSQLSQEYENRLQTITNEIIAIQNHDYKVPLIGFSGNDFDSFITLFRLFKRI